MTNNGITKYLTSFYRFTTSFNNMQTGFVTLADAYSGLLAFVNKSKTADLKALQNAVDAQVIEIKKYDVGSTARDNANKDFSTKQAALKTRELEYESLIQGLTPIVTSIQQQVKTNSSGASLLPQIGEAVLAILSKVVELASSIRV